MDARSLQKAGYSVQFARRELTFAQAIVARADESIRLDWAADSAFRYFPVVPDEVLGFRLREGFALRQFTIAVDCLGQGCGLRDQVDNTHMEVIIRATGPGGEPQEWTLFAIGFESLVQQFFEIDPDWSPGAGGG